MIRNIWILNKGGILLFSKSYVKLKVSEDLFVGFLSAIDSFIKETTKGEIKNISLKGSKFTYLVSPDLIIVMNSEEQDNDILLQKLLNQIKTEFLEEFQEKIRYLSVDTTQFTYFNDRLVKILEYSQINITCSNCGVTIIGNFQTKTVDEEKIYFCCLDCERTYLLTHGISNNL